MEPLFIGSSVYSGEVPDREIIPSVLFDYEEEASREINVPQEIERLY